MVKKSEYKRFAGGRGKKADIQQRLQGVWSYSKTDNSIGNERSKHVIDYYKKRGKDFATQKDFLEEALLFMKEQEEGGVYRVAEVAVTSELYNIARALSQVVKRLEALDFTGLRSVVPNEFQHEIDAMERQIFNIRGDTSVMIGSVTSVEIEDNEDW